MVLRGARFFRLAKACAAIPGFEASAQDRNRVHKNANPHFSQADTITMHKQKDQKIKYIR